MPERFSKNGCVFTADEILLCGLFRIHTPNFFDHKMWVDVFGWLQSRASIAFSLFWNFMMTNWIYLITDNMNYWLPHFSEFAEAIEQKVNSYLPGSVAEGTNRVICFIDNTCIPTARPGGGPNHRNGHRWDPLIQRSFYNGWKSIHGIKVQTLDLPNGMNLHITLPSSLRHNDIWMFNESDVENKFIALQAGQPTVYSLYGDSAYAVIMSPVVQFATGLPRDTPMNSCRESIEWNYGHLKTFCRLLEQRSTSMKLRHSAVQEIVLVGILLRNFHTSFRGNISSGNFMCQPPSFEDYVAAGPRAM